MGSGGWLDRRTTSRTRYRAVLFTTTFGTLPREFSPLHLSAVRLTSVSSLPPTTWGHVRLDPNSETIRPSTPTDHPDHRRSRPGRSIRRSTFDRSRQAGTDVVSIDVLEMDAAALQQEGLTLRRRVVRLLCLMQLVVVALKVSGFSFERVRIPAGSMKQRLFLTIERARIHMPLRGVLQLIGMSRTRYHA